MREELAELASRLWVAVEEGRTPLQEAEQELGRRAFELLAPDQNRPILPQRERSTLPTGDPRVAAVLLRLAELGDPASWQPAPEYASTALAAVDAIWSIGVRYTGVVNVIARYCAARVDQGADPQTDTPAELLAFIDACGSSEGFATAVRNRQRTSSTNGILKAEAVREAAAILVAHGVEDPHALRSLESERRGQLEAEWRAIRGQASGLSWDYFLMLNGMTGVKADRMVRRFVAEALSVRENAVAPSTARALVLAASADLGLDARITDFAIWEALSAR